MTTQEREAIRLLAVLGLIISVLLLIQPGVGLLLTFALGLWLHHQFCQADIHADTDDKTWW